MKGAVEAVVNAGLNETGCSGSKQHSDLYVNDSS